MKVLLVNCVYAYGSTGKIIVDIESGLKDVGIDVIVAYGRGRRINRPNLFKLAPEFIFKIQSFISKVSGYSYACSAISTYSLIRLIKRERPDIVNLHCINANTVDLAATITYLKHNHINTAISIHAEFPFTGGCGYSLSCEKWRTGCERCPQFRSAETQCPKSFFFDRTAWQWNQLSIAYRNFDKLLITCVSPWLKDRAITSPFFEDKKVITVFNGLDTAVFRPRDISRLKKIHGLTNEKIILHVTPNFYSLIKGGKTVIEIAKRIEHDKKYKVIICGYNGDGEDLPSNVIPIRFTRDQIELAEYYSLADVTLLTSQKETFSMITAESICCGTPIVGYKAGGPESIAIKANSIFVDYGDIEELHNVLLKSIDDKIDNPVNIADAHSLYSLKTMTGSYLQIFKNMLNDKNTIGE